MPKKSNEELYEEAEAELYGEAIRQTEQEIHDDALGLAPDENDGDNSLEQMDGDDAPDGDEEPTDETEGDEPDESEEGEGEGDEPETDRQPERGQDRRGVPPGRLREESEARRAAQAEREATQAENRELRARLDALERNGRQPAQRDQQPERPDMFADPQAWEQHLRAEIANGIAARNVNASLTDAREEHGERFDVAYQDLIRAGQSGDRQTVQQIWDSPNPGRALMRWHDRQQVIRDVGSDPNAYRTKVARELMQDPEFRQQMVETLRDDAMNGNGNRGAPRTRVRLPASLNGASGGAGHRSRDPGPTRGGGFSASTEREIADSVWDN